MMDQRTDSASDLCGPLVLTRAATAILDGRGLVIGWSPAAQRLLGYAPDEVIGGRGDDLLAAPKSVPAGLRAAFAGREGSAFGEVVSARHRDGHTVEVAVSVCRVDQGGAEPVWVLAAADRQDEVEWETRQAMLQGLATQSPIGLAIYDRELRLIWANAGSDDEVGAPLSEYLGKTSEDLYGPGEVLTQGYGSTLREVMRRVLETGEPAIDLHVRGQPPTEPKEDLVWSCSYYRLMDGRGNILGVCEDGVDITDRYRAQQRLALMALAGRRIGTTLTVEGTAGQLAEVAVPSFADGIMVDLVPAVLDGEEPTAGSARQPLVRVARRALAVSHDGPREDDRLSDGAFTERVWYDPGSAQAVCLATGEPVLERGDAETGRRLSGSGRDAAMSRLVVPLRARGAMLGLVTFLRGRTVNPFDVDERTLGEELVAHSAACLDNARRYTREHRAAVTLQRTLLPRRLPALTAMEVACRYLPAESQAGVGGDWFDVIPLSGTRVGLVVGDVAGHGLRAAATMGRLRTTVRALARLDLAPGELLGRLDDLVGQTTEGVDWGADRAVSASAGMRGGSATGGWSSKTAGTQFGPDQEVFDDAVGATCLYAIYDPVSGCCSLARAGHPPPAVVDAATGEVDFPDLPPGPPLGLGGLPFETTEINLPHGSLLALYTDGLVESRGQDIEAGLDQLAHILADPTRPLEEMCDQTLASLQSGEPARDDITMLLARTRLLDAEQVAVWELPARPAAVRLARSLAGEQLDRWGLRELAFTTDMVVSELVTNAILYATQPIQLRLIRDRTFISEVSDPGHTSPHLRRAAAYDEGGRGLFIVAQLVQSWGTRYTPDGKTIWAEQALPGSL
ncbi:SpoIIE family protein phosphatase [Streptomyces sp. M41]|uniref:SpoIIE family protein phosphatase n=1 Tax=Streptomyces sp. M41 TaxID=3059412 RepID=UPI00374DB0BE